MLAIDADRELFVGKVKTHGMLGANFERTWQTYVMELPKDSVKEDIWLFTLYIVL